MLLLPCFIIDGSDRLGEIDLTLCSSTTQFSDLLRLLANNAAPEHKLMNQLLLNNYVIMYKI